MQKQISYKIVSLVFSVLVICFAVGFYVLAVWTEPGAAPPGGNVDSPVNVSINPQYKVGSLRLGGLTVDSSTYLATQSGNVGIGTTAPGAELEVAGQVKITGGTPGAGKVLTSDASGLSSWQVPAAGGGFGVWNDRTKDGVPDTVVLDQVYRAETDGIAMAWVQAAGGWPRLVGRTDSNNPPNTIRVVHEITDTGGDFGEIIMPVRKNDFWKIGLWANRIYTSGGFYTPSYGVYWLPIGN